MNNAHVHLDVLLHSTCVRANFRRDSARSNASGNLNRLPMSVREIEVEGALALASN